MEFSVRIRFLFDRQNMGVNMKKLLVFALVIFMLAGVAGAYACSTCGCSGKATKSAAESGWTKVYNDISIWSWGSSSKSGKSDKKACAPGCTKECCSK